MDTNIIDINTRQALFVPDKTGRYRQADAFERGDSIAFVCGGIRRRITGTIITIEIDPLSGRQWRVLAMTEFGTRWLDITEVTPC